MLRAIGATALLWTHPSPAFADSPYLASPRPGWRGIDDFRSVVGRFYSCSRVKCGNLVIPLQCGQEFPLPAVDVVVVDRRKQRLMAVATLLDRHGQRLGDGAGNRFSVIRIDQKSTAEFDGGSGKARQDED